MDMVRSHCYIGDMCSGMFRKICRLMIQCILIIMFIVFAYSKIVRVGRDFSAFFSIVDSNGRVTRNCIGNYTNVSKKDCVAHCIHNKRCQTFNYNCKEKICEILDVSKFDGLGYLEWHKHWTHYETDCNHKKIGPICNTGDMCKDFQICEDTFDKNKFICRCTDGFTGEKCETYIGPGSNENNPAPSCYLLFGKYKSLLPNGDYWIKKGKVTKKKFCRRKEEIVNGNWGEWSKFGNCTVTCGEGEQSRNRSCNKPSAAGGGLECLLSGERDKSKRGQAESQTQICNGNKCPVNGNWGGWYHTRCSVTCGEGTRIIGRSCNKPSAANGGLECLLTGVKDERGEQEKTKKLCKEIDCPVNGNWGPWSEIGKCNVTCGGGVKTRNRSCSNPSAASGGLECLLLGYKEKRGQEEIETEICIAAECGGTCSTSACPRRSLLANGERIYSPNGNYKLSMQNGGNLVIYCNDKATWSSSTPGANIKKGMFFHENGDLVLYNEEDDATLWNSGTAGSDATKLSMEDDGNLVLYGGEATDIRWSSNTSGEC